MRDVADDGLDPTEFGDNRIKATGMRFFRCGIRNCRMQQAQPSPDPPTCPTHDVPMLLRRER